MASSDIKPYPFMFDPSQWANKYSPFAGQALPFMGQYSGGSTGPTDAHGNPIASYQAAQAAHDAWQPPAPSMAPATTLNSAPQLTGFGTGLAAAGSAQDPAMQARINPGPSAYYAPSSSGFTSNQYDNGRAPLVPFAQAPIGPQQRQAAPAAPPTNPIDMNAAYLQALSNPGKVTTPGATVPQANLPSGQSGVLQQFLQNWQGGGGNTQGAGNYNNRGFFAGLQGGQ